MKANGRMIRETGKGSSDIQMVTLTMDLSRMVKLMAKEFIPGTMERYMMENGKMV
jgi:hypothetical protein